MSNENQNTSTPANFIFAKVFDYESGHQIVVKKFYDEECFKLNFETSMSSYHVDTNVSMEREEDIDRLFQNMNADRAYEFMKHLFNNLIF